MFDLLYILWRAFVCFMRGCLIHIWYDVIRCMNLFCSRGVHVKGTLKCL